jgi:hypothetical protein
MSNSPIPGITIAFNNETELSYLNTQYNNVDVRNQQKDITNYEYEISENEKKRQILLLRPEYLGVFISDMKNIMKYDKSSDYIDSKTKGVYNPKLKGV